MNDDIFDDELELNERGADQDGSPRIAIASQPIRDGSRALLHDGYDVQLFHDAAGEYPRLAELIASARERLITAPALICDVFWSFFKHAPEIGPVVPLTPAHQLHANILEHLMATREWHEVRAAGTIGDVFNSAVATIGAAESALGALSAAVVAAINHLHELESGAADLFAQAQALADEAEQAEGDAGAELFAQAARARAEAEELERAEQQAAEAIAAQAEPIEDTTRRAARAGMRAAAEQIEDATAAIKTFGGGYGPGLGWRTARSRPGRRSYWQARSAGHAGSSKSQPCAAGLPASRCTFSQPGFNIHPMRLPTSNTAAILGMCYRPSWRCLPIPHSKRCSSTATPKASSCSTSCWATRSRARGRSSSRSTPPAA